MAASIEHSQDDRDREQSWCWVGVVVGDEAWILTGVMVTGIYTGDAVIQLIERSLHPPDII